MQHCNKTKHIKSQIINTTSNFTWFYCSRCGLLYSGKKNFNHKHYKNRLKVFDDFKDANKYEFNNIIKKIKKIKKISNKEWFDYGCGTGSLLNQIKGETKKIVGFEPNKILFKKAKKKKLPVYNNLKKINKNKKFDIVFSRNTFKYIDNFPEKIFEISKKVKLEGLLVWRDKFFNYYPLRSMKNDKLDNIHESLITGSYLNKNAIMYHLNVNKFKILYSKFYLDNSFLIIAKKTRNIINPPNNLLNLDLFLLKNQFLVEVIHSIRKGILIFFKSLKKLI